MSVIVHVGYWLTGLVCLACLVVIVAVCQSISERFSPIDWPRWMERLGGWLGTGIAYLAAAVAIIWLPLLIGMGIWGKLPS